jgi:hypothetical protein
MKSHLSTIEKIEHTRLSLEGLASLTFHAHNSSDFCCSDFEGISKLIELVCEQLTSIENAIRDEEF